MKKSRNSEEQIIGILKQHESGVKTADVCREHGISAATFYSWKQEVRRHGRSEAQRLKQMEDENRHLKQLVADLSLDKEALKSVMRKNGCEWSRVDLDARVLTVPRAKHREKRKVFLNDTAIAAFRLLWGFSGGAGKLFGPCTEQSLYRPKEVV